jgi:hypothetical protein
MHGFCARNAGDFQKNLNGFDYENSVLRLYRKIRVECLCVGFLHGAIALTANFFVHQN